jgi:hypothetical protein
MAIKIKFSQIMFQYQKGFNYIKICVETTYDCEIKYNNIFIFFIICIKICKFLHTFDKFCLTDFSKERKKFQIVEHSCNAV